MKYGISIYIMLILQFLVPKAAMAQGGTDPAIAKQLKHIRQLSNRKSSMPALRLTDSILQQVKLHRDTKLL